MKEKKVTGKLTAGGCKLGARQAVDNVHGDAHSRRPMCIHLWLSLPAFSRLSTH